MRNHHEPIPPAAEPCNAIAPMLELYRCQREFGHTGHHVFNSITWWDDADVCPHCRGPWDGTEGRCVENDCITELRKRCVGCGLRAGEVFQFTHCTACECVICAGCSEQWGGGPHCPECLRAVQMTVAGGSERSQGTAGVSREAPSVVPCHPTPDEAA